MGWPLEARRSLFPDWPCCVMNHYHTGGFCTFLFKFWRENSICATGNVFVRLMPIRKMHFLPGSWSERGGARWAPTKRVTIKGKANN